MKEKLHWISGSPNAWRVLLLLEYKNIDFDSIRIDPTNWDRVVSNFYSLNPHGKVPVLEDGDFVLYESLAIMQYLDSKYPVRKLFGNNPKETGVIGQRISELIHYAIEPMYLLSRNLIRGKTVEDVLGSNKLAEIIYEELEKIENWLQTNPYFSGETLSASDLYFYPVIAFLERVSSKVETKTLELGFLPLNENFPKIKKWMQQIESISGFDKTIPPHWKD